MEERISITDKIIGWLYEHSSGNVSIVVALLHDAQEIGILSGYKELSIELLEMAYKQRMSVLHGYIDNKPTNKVNFSDNKKKFTILPEPKETDASIIEETKISDIVHVSKEKGIDIVSLLNEYHLIASEVPL